MVNHAVNNDLQCFQQVSILKQQYPILGRELLLSMQRQFWYLTQDLVVSALEDLENEIKKEMLSKMLDPQNQAP